MQMVFLIFWTVDTVNFYLSMLGLHLKAHCIDEASLFITALKECKKEKNRPA